MAVTTLHFTISSLRESNHTTACVRAISPETSPSGLSGPNRAAVPAKKWGHVFYFFIEVFNNQVLIVSFHGNIILCPAAQGGFLKINIRLKPAFRSFGKSQSGRYPQCHTFHSCLFSVTHAIKLSVSISGLGFTRNSHFHLCLRCCTVCFPFFLREQKG